MTVLQFQESIYMIQPLIQKQITRHLMIKQYQKSEMTQQLS